MHTHSTGWHLSTIFIVIVMALLYYFAFNYAASVAFNGMASILAPVGTGTILIWLGGWSVGICVYSDIHWALSDRTFTPAWIWKCVFNWNEDFQPFFFIFVNMHDYLIFDQGRNLIQSGYVNSNPTFCTSPPKVSSTWSSHPCMHWVLTRVKIK